MGAKYTEEPISSDLISDWSNAKPPSDLAVPESNKYLAESTSIKTNEPSREWKQIRKILETPNGELFFKADSKFNLPRGFIILLIRSDIIRQSPKNDAIFDFFPFLLVRIMAEVAYDAETADLHYGFDSDCHGFKINVSGLDDKLPLLYQEVLNQIKNFQPNQTEFDSLKAQFLDNYSTYMKIPENVSSLLFYSIFILLKKGGFSKSLNCSVVSELIVFIQFNLMSFSMLHSMCHS